ncbi:hypothetical protein AB0939_12450 [Streptomyces sp. NPDC006990]|uniref:hypothetical protein n=1 Tax=unclassified Streptomyces TaxID=2593676 RepID=UPI003456CE1F
MEDSCKKAVIAAVAGGYLLGRTRKAKLALVLGSAVAGRRLGLDPQELVSKGVRKLSETPQFAALTEQVQEELLSTARTALSAVTNRRIESFTESLRGRTESLSPKEAADGEQESGEGEEERDEEVEEEPEEESGEPRRRPAKKAPAKSDGGGRRPAKRSGTGAQTASVRSGGRKTESSSAKKTSGGSDKRSAARSSRRR